MLNENARRWVEALRSGEYKQGKGALHSGDTFCCLGVACDLAKGELGLEWVPDDDGIYRIGGKGCVLPSPVADWLGLCTPYGRVTPTDSLAGRNDEGASFAAIADLIESEPPGLFE